MLTMKSVRGEVLQGRCTMFVRNIDLALQRAEASYSREIWQMMTASERSAAIYRELQALDAQSKNDGSYIPTRLLRRRGRRRATSA
jgi:hypothetical protein